jgi:hypothetical protein
MLQINASVLARVVTRAQRNVLATQPSWAQVIGQTAHQLLTRAHQITECDDGALHIELGRRAIDASSDSCTCTTFRRWRTCEHRLLAWLYRLYCEELAAHSV